MKRPLALVGILLVTFSHADELDDHAKAHMTEEHIPGMAIGICHGDKLVYERYYGVSNLETNSPTKPTTVFRIASMSKQFTASAIMLLVEEGKIQLDASVLTYLPEAPASWKAITVRNLLNHTSGIPDPGPFNYAREYTNEQFFNLFKDKPLASEPGSKYAYSNYGFNTLGLIVKAVSGKPLREFVQERIFSKVGMNDSRYYTLSDIVIDRAFGYYYEDEHFRNTQTYRPAVFDGSGGVMTTIRDLAKWDAALKAHTVLSPNLLDQMWTPATLTTGKKTTYGFAWTTKTGSYGPEVSHNGTTFGFTSRWRRLLKSGWTVIIFRNSEGTDGGINKFESWVTDWAVKQPIP